MFSALQGVSRFLTRFALFYWLCFVFPFPADLAGLPFRVLPPAHQPAWMKVAGESYGQGYQWLINQKQDACKWVGREVLGQEVIVQPTGSGDTLRNYVGCLCAAAMALALTCLWSLALFLLPGPRSGPADARFHAAVRVVVRFFLLQMLFGYGFAKVFPLQFPEPTYRLTQSFGDLSPMGLLWAFMGFSTPYQIFTGAVEAAAGLLLATRRTTPLGAIMTIVAMTQVVALNFGFDVPVKLYSLHYLAMAVFLLAPDLPRILRVLVLHQAVEAAPLRPLFGSVAWDRVAIVFRTLVVASLLWTNIYQGYERWNDRYGGPPAPVHGRWETTSFKADGKDLGPDDPRRWKTLDFTIKGMARAYGPNPPPSVYKVTWNEEENRLTLGRFMNSPWTALFNYEFTASGELTLTGTLDGKSVAARLKQLPDKKYELTNRGFHWIQEMPYNR